MLQEGHFAKSPTVYKTVGQGVLEAVLGFIKVGSRPRFLARHFPASMHSNLHQMLMESQVVKMYHQLVVKQVLTIHQAHLLHTVLVVFMVKVDTHIQLMMRLEQDVVKT